MSRTMMFAPVSLFALLFASSCRAAFGFVAQSAPAAPARQSTTALSSSFEEARPRRRSPFYKTAAGGGGGGGEGSHERRSPFSSRTRYSGGYTGAENECASGYTSGYSSTSSSTSYSSTGDGGGASIPFMITQKMKRALIEDLRYSRREVESMSAEVATSILAGGIASSRTVPCSYNRKQQDDQKREEGVGVAAVEGASESFEGAGYEQWEYQEDSPPLPPPLEDPLVEMEEQFGDHCQPHQQQQHWEPSQQEHQYQPEPQYQYQPEPPIATDPLTEMEEQFGEVTEEVLGDDRYGPSVFSTSRRKGRFSSLSKGPSSWNRRDRRGEGTDSSPWVTRDPY